MKSVAAIYIGAALLATPAFAQSAPPAATSSMPSATGMTWMTQPQTGQWQATELEGLSVYNSNDEKIGEISEMLLGSDGKIQAVVVGVGGFLGIGQRDVAVPFEQITFVNEARSTASATGTSTTGTAASGTAGTAATGTAAPGTMGTGPAATGSVGAAPAASATGANRAATDSNRFAPDHAVLKMSMTKDELKAVPEFKMSQ